MLFPSVSTVATPPYDLARSRRFHITQAARDPAVMAPRAEAVPPRPTAPMAS
jgi:hypothetical protein